MPDYSKFNQLDVIRNCIKNDRQAQNRLYREYYSYGMSIAIRYVKSQNSATEILNDSFYKVFKNLKKFDASKDFKPWFARIVVNTSLSYLKKESRFESTDIEEVTHTHSVENDFDKSIGYDEILDMIGGLSIAYRTVFNLYVIDGYKHEEVADRLGITVGTSKSNLSRAKEHLRGMLNKRRNTQYV